MVQCQLRHPFGRDVVCVPVRIDCVLVKFEINFCLNNRNILVPQIHSMNSQFRWKDKLPLVI